MREATYGQAKVATNHTGKIGKEKRKKKKKTAMLLTVTQPCSPNALFFDALVVFFVPLPVFNKIN